MGGVYKLIELVGTSKESYEDAINNAVKEAQKTLHDLRWFEVVELRGHIGEEGVSEYQAKIRVAFKIVRK